MKKPAWLTPELIGLTVLSFLTRFWGLFSPNAVVFDEVYFKDFASRYFTGQYYFDIHPPLGKLLLALGARLLGYTGDVVSHSPAVGIRIFPALAGSLIIPLFYLLLRRLNVPRHFATLGAAFLLFDGAMLVESRFILVDAFLLLFSLAGLYVFLGAQTAHTKAQTYRRSLLAGVWLGAAVSVKWTGLGMLGLVGLLLLFEILTLKSQAKITHKITQGLMILGVAMAVYVSVFVVHFALLTKTGDGAAFMSPRFQSGLVGSGIAFDDGGLNTVQKFTELNTVMYTANAGIKATHPYSSVWYSWPLDYRGVYYWQNPLETDGPQGNIYLIGNPLVWWLALAGMALSLWILIDRRTRTQIKGALIMLWLGYMINLVPFMGVHRVLFLYHYLLCLVLGVGITVASLWAVQERYPHWPWQRILIGFYAVLIISFIFFAPVYYGTPLSSAGLQLRMWLPTWR